MAQLALRVFRAAEGDARKVHPRLRDAGDTGVAQQRQDRVEIGAHRELGLTFLVQLAVKRDDSGDELALGVEQKRLVRRVEPLPLADQRAKGGIPVAGRLTGPGEVEPDLQVEEIPFGEKGGAGGGASGNALSRHAVQLVVAWVGLDHAPPVRREEVLQQEEAVGERQLRR